MSSPTSKQMLTVLETFFFFPLNEVPEAVEAKVSISQSHRICEMEVSSALICAFTLAEPYQEWE